MPSIRGMPNPMEAFKEGESKSTSHSNKVLFWTLVISLFILYMYLPVCFWFQWEDSIGLLLWKLFYLFLMFAFPAEAIPLPSAQDHLFASQSKEDKILEASSRDEGFICPACPSSKSVSTTSAFFFFWWTLGGSFTRRMSAFSSATVHFWRRFLILSTSPSSSQFAQEAKKTPAAAVVPSSLPVLSEAEKIKELTTGNCGRTEGTTAIGQHLMPRLRPVLTFCQPQWSRSCESRDYHGNTRYREMVYIVRGPSLKRWLFGPTRGNKGLTFPTFSLTYEKQFWLGRTEQKRVKLDENEQRVFCLWLPWQRASLFKKPAV